MTAPEIMVAAILRRGESGPQSSVLASSLASGRKSIELSPRDGQEPSLSSNRGQRFGSKST